MADCTECVVNSLGNATDVAPSQAAVQGFIDGLATGNGADRAGITPLGVGAVTRGAASMLKTFGFQAKSYGAAENGSTDDRTPLTNLLSAAGDAVSLMTGDYSTSAGPPNPNPALSDPDPSALYITQSGSVLDGLGTGQITCTGANKSIIHVKNALEVNRPVNGAIRNFRKLNQAYGNPEAGGLNDDYFAVRLEGCYDWTAENLHIDQCELGFTDQFVETAVYCKYFTFDADTDVSTANDTITIDKDLNGAANAHDFVTGSRVAMTMSGTSAWSLTGATPPAGIAAPFRYYVIVVDSTTIKLAASYDDAFAGTAVDITALGAGTITIIRMDRVSKRNTLSNFTISKCAYMGVQLGGCTSGAYTGIRVSGQDSDGHSRGATHGVRSDGLFQALTEQNFVRATVSRMGNGLSLQSWSEHNDLGIIANDCKNGISTTRPSDLVAAAKYNSIDLVSTGGDYGIFEDGNSYNIFTVNILNPRIRGINATNGGGGIGLAIGNTYRGQIRRTESGSTQRLAQLDGQNTNIDMVLEGSGSTATDTAVGLISTGNGIFGKLRVSSCQIGAQFGGSGGRVTVKSSGCGTDIVIAATASDLTIECDCDGNVAIASGATNITLTGRVGGTVSDGGTGTDLSKLNPKSGSVTQTTDANGFIAIAHGLGRIPKVVAVTTTDNAFRTFSVTGRSSTTLTVRVWSGPLSPLVSSSTSFIWEAY